MSSISSKDKVSFNGSPVRRFNTAKSDAGTDSDPVSPAEGSAAVTEYESLDPDDQGRNKKQQQPPPQQQQKVEDVLPKEISGLLAAQEQSEKHAPTAGKKAYSAQQDQPAANRKLADV